MSIRLYVGNLPKELEKKELEEVFADFDNTISTKLITDRKTGKCRGFGFVTVKNDEQADQLIEKYNGFLFKDTPLKIEKALPRSKGKEEGEAQPVSSAPISSGASSSGGGGSSSSKRSNKGNNNKSRSKSSSGGSGDLDSVQPDPRWASALEELKQRLATTAN